ncbi:hypothetical protein JL722_15229 [Aureococcus anophagefferens]|nr:hypothetical protein JL722_15229 [Aureococcus anophagefferens]
MVQCWWCVAWAVSSAAAADCGVCWTRNGVASLNATALEGKLAGVWLSATLLRRGDPALRTCLVTDAPAALARRALDATSARAGEAPGLIGLVVARVAQAGAMVARRTNGRAFVGDWLDGFLKYHLYHPGWHGDAIDPSTKHPDRVAGREFGRDQPPLDKLLAAACAAGAARRAWTLGKLPAALNVRKANAQPVLVWGKHVTLHTKQLTTNARPVESLPIAAAGVRRRHADAAWRLLAMPDTNPVKVASVKAAFAKSFGAAVVTSSHDVASGVSDQPYGDLETRTGASSARPPRSARTRTRTTPWASRAASSTRRRAASSPSRGWP